MQAATLPKAAEALTEGPDRGPTAGLSPRRPLWVHRGEWLVSGGRSEGGGSTPGETAGAYTQARGGTEGYRAHTDKEGPLFPTWAPGKAGPTCTAGSITTVGTRTARGRKTFQANLGRHKYVVS